MIAGATSVMCWEPYDPSWPVALAREQLPGEAWLAEALARCTSCRIESPAYVYFIDPRSPAWQHETCLEIDSPVHGWVVLDVLRDRRIGGVELVDKIEK
jgi:hypothetical protein